MLRPVPVDLVNIREIEVFKVQDASNVAKIIRIKRVQSNIVFSNR